ncbi:MAG: M20/M25/M40 family metallo-hydrolase, partial [bacterium]
SLETLNAILGGTGMDADSLQKLANTNKSGFHLELPITLEIEAHGKIIKDAPTRNVLAKIPGTDPDLAHEIVLVGAHMDHLGVDAAGRIYNGAEDNASGTALLMELARTLIERGEQPKRSVYFCAFAAEELGLMGSEAFVNNPPIPLDSVVAMINMDMVGEGGDGASIGGGCNFPEAIDIWEGALTESQLERIYQFKPGYYSDHAPFEDVGIPSFAVFGRGEHKFYHQPEDTAELVQPEVLSEVGGMVYAGMLAFVNHEESLHREGRYERYLWDASETVLIGSPEIPFDLDGDAPDLILYNATGKTSSLEDVLLGLDSFESSLLQESFEVYSRISRIDEIPTGKQIPALALGLGNPLSNNSLPELYRTLQRLDVSFVMVPENQLKKYFGKSGLNAEGLSFLLTARQVGLKSIWEVKKLADGASLAGATTSPVVIRVSGGLKGYNPDLLPESNHCFFLFDVDPIEGLELAAFEALADRIGWPDVGIYAETFEDAEEMIGRWLDAGYEQNLINGLLGDHLVLFLRK